MASITNNTANGLNQDAEVAALPSGYDGRGNETFDGPARSPTTRRTA